MIRLEQLHIYPVKSLAGISRQRAVVTAQGLQGDREWMVVDSQYSFVTQRQIPRLAKIKTALDRGTLSLNSPEMGEIKVEPPHINTPLISVRVWNSQCQARLATSDVNAWLTEAAQSAEPLHLAYFDRSHTRQTDARRFGQGNIYFADAAPYLITNTASLRALNDKLARERLLAADMRQFRPNIVISGVGAFNEHSIDMIEIANGVRFGLHDHCQRCAVITVDQDSGKRREAASPLKQLIELNTMPNNNKAPAFGVNSTLMAGLGKIIQVDDELICQTTEETMEH